MSTGNIRLVVCRIVARNTSCAGSTASIRGPALKSLAVTLGMAEVVSSKDGYNNTFLSHTCRMREFTVYVPSGGLVTSQRKRHYAIVEARSKKAMQILSCWFHFHCHISIPITLRLPSCEEAQPPRGKTLRLKEIPGQPEAAPAPTGSQYTHYSNSSIV